MHSSDVGQISNTLRDAALGSYRASVVIECYAAIDKLARELFELSEMFEPIHRDELINFLTWETSKELQELLTAKLSILKCAKWENHKERENDGTSDT